MTKVTLHHPQSSHHIEKAFHEKAMSHMEKAVQQKFNFKSKKRGRSEVDDAEPSTSNDDIHSGTTRKVIHWTTGKKHNKHASGAWHSYMQDHNYLILAPVGQAGWADLNSIGSLTQWETSTGTAYGAYQSDTSYFSLNPFQQISGSQIYAAGLKPLNDQFYIKNVATVIDVTNLENTAGYYKLHILQAKRDTALTPIQTWQSLGTSNALGASKLSGPSSSATATVGYQAPSGVVATTSVGGANGFILGNAVPSITPQVYKEFKTLYKTLHTHTFELAAAANERIMLHGTINWLYKQAVGDVPNAAYNKGTIFFQLEWVGAVGASNATGANATHSPSQVGLVVRHMMKFQTVYGADKRIETAYGATYEVTGGSVNIMNVQDSGIVTGQAK